MVWVLEKNGKFTVKSAYNKMLKERNGNHSVGMRMQGIFKRLWKLPILPRTNQFLWKCVKNILPTRDKLADVIQDEEFGCPFCSHTLETASHVILECPLSKAVWFGGLGIHISQGSNLMDWLCSWFDKLIARQVQESEGCKISIVAWCIWNMRCDKVFKGIVSSPEAIIHKCKREFAVLEKKHNTNYRITLPQNRIHLYWQPPPVEYHKINSDDSYYADNNSGGIGLICIDFAGLHQGSKCIYLATATSPEQAESKALWEAMNWAAEKELEKVVFELDAKLVVDAVQGVSLNIDWRLHNLILDIKNLLSSHLFWQCSYVPKEKNKVADSLSKLARTQRMSGVWLLDPPEEILYQLQEETNHVNAI
ncbi:uncharacterized protein LOC113359923 [Papaver somniferum]|uniref:uncharacterized protein LOC113359923 n=1 Tax=Papaver somniferum TaxID=3469 RepID=UPI000E6FFA39|nr:uncharacterized protein LOC113359923 [Papaver somniferum]